MLNQSAEYALRAALLMAHNGADEAWKASAIAAALGVPANYLSKVMHVLARAGVFTSVRGPSGGYTLAEPPARIRLVRVVEPFQQLDPGTTCLMGDRPCDHAQPCVAHQRWSRHKDAFSDFLHNTTLADMLEPLPPALVNMTLTEVA